jgi:monofunctional glycosyltransferase
VKRGGGVAARVLRALFLAALAGAALSVVWVTAYLYVAPPLTPLMVIRRAVDGAAMDRRWVPLSAISPNLTRAVIASEDTKFCAHNGFDWDAIANAAEANEDGDRLRGGSTISNQTAKNAFLWPGRSFLRKGVEAWFTFLIEHLWTKRRILEVYLNIIEWGDGTYGAEMAAQTFFDRPAKALSAREAALMAVVLPSPRNWQPNRPTPYIARRADAIRQRMAVVERDGLADCALEKR